MTETLWLWIGFNVFVLAMLALDLGVFHRKCHVVTFRESITCTVVWEGQKFRMHDTGCKMQDTGYRIQDTGYRIQDAGYRMHDAGYRMHDAGLTTDY